MREWIAWSTEFGCPGPLYYVIGRGVEKTKSFREAEVLNNGKEV
jgi:hypothetical protein